VAEINCTQTNEQERNGILKINIRLSVLMAVLLSIVLSSCDNKRIVELKKEHLFSIPIGSGEEEIGILRESSGRFLGPSHVIFRNGFFFVVDPVNQKIMKITTPGDVIMIISDSDIMTAEEDEAAILRTKQKKFHDFDEISRIAVDNVNNVYVENIFLQDDSADTETEYEEQYMSYILKFDRLGSFVYSIGMHGKNSEPFYYVYSIDIDEKGNLIVLTGDDNWENWTYYSYDRDGNRIGTHTITNNDIIGENNFEGKAYFVMDVVPTERPDQIVYWISTYDTSHDTKEIKREEDLWGEEIEIENIDQYKEEMEGKTSDLDVLRDLLYYELLFYDLKSGSEDRSHKWEMSLNNRVETTEEFLGLDGLSNCFFWKYVDKNKSIISIRDPDGSVVTQRSFVFEEDGLWTNLDVALDGSVSAIKINRSKVHFYRWRSDRLIYDKREEQTVREFITEKIEGFRNANR
jgi:hypothetical protein